MLGRNAHPVAADGGGHGVNGLVLAHNLCPQPLVQLAQPNLEDTMKILRGIAHYYESFHGVQIPEGILRQAVLLSERYITDRFLPDKAIDLVDEACALM